MQALKEKLEASGCRCIAAEEERFLSLWREFEWGHADLSLDYALPTQEYQYAYFLDIYKVVFDFDIG